MMRRLLLGISASLVVAAAVNPVAAQQFPGVELPPGVSVLPFDPNNPLVVAPQTATTVQLPTFNFFTISTSVMVPDRGGAYLGGVGRGASAGRSNGAPGLPGSRAFGSSAEAGGVSIGVQIHDFEATDRALLGSSNPTSADAARVDAWHARLTRAKQSTAGRPAISIAEARVQVRR